MADLVARGLTPKDVWQRPMPANPVTLGRLAERSDWDVPWDRQISGLHVTLTRQPDGTVRVSRTSSGRNPIFFRGQPVDEFSVAVGESFVIGETTFSVVEPGDSSLSAAATTDLVPGTTELPSPVAEVSCSHQDLGQVRFGDADTRIEVLADLPEVIRLSPSEADLEARVADVLLRGIVRAEAVAVVRLRTTGDEVVVDVHAARSREGEQAALRPSRRLVLDAVQRRRQSVLYCWDLASQRPELTVSTAIDWAFCVPLPDDPSPGWGLYVAGRDGSEVAANREEQRKGDLKFTELVANIFGSLRQVHDLQRRHAQLTSVLSRPVLSVLALEDVEQVLRPRETDVTVLFCDLRGSCRLTEEGQDDLPGLWARVSGALGIMTGCILDQDGVIGDFQGDAAMGFWGWPLPVPDQAERAARAALNIQRRFDRAAQETGHALAGFSCGIGIAGGRAIAGKLGTADQFKVGVFGPVVNLASRLESMTKQLGVPILLDEATAALLGDGGNSRPAHWCRCRRLARVQPYGMQTIVTVSELLPPAVEAGGLTEQRRRDYEAALDAFLAGRWTDASALLRRLPNDRPAGLLQAFMEGKGEQPPVDWDGVIALDAK